MFSCEIAGKAIVGSSDAADAEKVSAICEAEPEKVAASKPLVVSAADAMAKHADFMRAYTAKQKKRAGVDSDEEIPDLMAHPELRRHSARQPKPIRNAAANDQPDAPEPDDDFELGEEGAGGGAASSRKRKSTPSVIAHSQYHPEALSSVDDAKTRALIEKMLAEDAGMGKQAKGKGRGRPKKDDTGAAKAKEKSPKKAAPVPPPTEEEEEEEEDKMSDVEEEDDGAGDGEEDNAKASSHSKAAAASPAMAVDSSSDVQEASPKKKQRTTADREPALIITPKKQAATTAAEESDSDLEILEVKKSGAPPRSPARKPAASTVAKPKISPAKSAVPARPSSLSSLSAPKPLVVHKPAAPVIAPTEDDDFDLGD